MKYLRCPAQSGHVLLYALGIVGLTGLLLVVLLTLASSQNSFTMRSFAWASEIPLAEAGIEEAMAHLNSSGVTNRAANGWTLSGGQYVKQRTLDAGYFYGAISTSSPPTITCTGYARIPAQSGYTWRAVRVTTTNAQTPYAILAKDVIKMSGGSIIDAFNSSDPLYSTGGAYDSTKSKDTARVGTLSSANPAIDAGGGPIYGYASTGPGGVAKLSSSSGIGTKFWVTANPATIQPGHFTDDMNVFISDVAVPFTSGYFTPGPGTVDGTNYTYVIDNGDYLLSACTIPGGGKMIVTGTARLYVTGKFTVSGSGYVYLKPSANFQLYVGSDITISGGGIVNGALKAANFTLYGLPSCTKATYSGSAQFIGRVNTPQADFTLSGSAGAAGAFVVNSISMTGGASIHYDEALGGGPAGATFLITSWTEL